MYTFLANSNILHIRINLSLGYINLTLPTPSLIVFLCANKVLACFLPPCHTFSLFHCQKPNYFALHRFACYSLSRVFVEGRALRGIPCARLKAADRWEALNLTEQTRGRAEDWARILWVPSRCHRRIPTIRFSDIAPETCSLIGPQPFFLSLAKVQSRPRNRDESNPLARPGCCISYAFHQKATGHVTIP